MAARKKKSKVSKKAAKKAKKTKPPRKKSPVEVAKAPVKTAISASTETQYTKSREFTQTEKRKRLKSVKHQLGDLLTSADQASTPYMVRRPTGITELDIHLGGGFAAGGASVLGGPYNSGKSWLLWRMFAMQQQIYGDAFVGAIANIEHALPYDQAVDAGCKIAIPDDVLNQWAEWREQRGMPKFTGEEVAQLKHQVGTIEFINGVTGEDILGNVLALNKENIFSIIGIDSISALTPAADVDKTLTEEQKRGSHATMMKKFLMHYGAQVRGGRNYTSLMCTQQAVANQSPYGFDWDLKGGEYVKHIALVTLMMWSGDKIYRGSEKNVVGKYMKYKTRKGKAGTHDNLSGEFPYYYHLGSVDVHGELMASAMRRGLLMNTGNRLQFLSATDRQPIDGLWQPNEQALREVLSMDFDFELAIRREIMASENVKCLYR